MNLFLTVCTSLSGLLILLLAIFIFSTSRRKDVNLRFGFICLSTSIWLLCYSVLHATSDKDIALFFIRFGYLGVIFMPVTFHHFTLTFLELNDKKNRILTNISYLLGLIFITTIGSKLFINGLFPFQWGLYPKASILHHFFLTFLYILSLRCLILLFIAYRKGRTSLIPLEFARLRYVLIAFVIGTFTTMDFIPTLGVNLYPFGFLFVTPFVFIIAYAIVRHQLMDIEVVIKKTIVFAGLLASVLAIIVLPTLIIQEYIFRKATFDLKIIGLIISGALIIVVIRRVDNFLVNITDKFLFQKEYNYREVLKKFQTDVLEYKDLNKLLPRITEDLVNIIRLESCVILIHDDEKNIYTIGSAKGKVDKSATFTDANPLMQFLKRTHSYILKDEMIKNLPASDKLKESLEKLRAELVFPLMLHNDIIGAIGFGIKKSGENYTQDDISTLDSVCFTLGTSISNSKLIREMLEVRAEAEQSDKMAAIGNLSAGINHEVCNPLGIARGNCEMFLLNYRDGLYKKKPKDEVINKALDIVKKVIEQVDRATHVTKALSQFSKPSKGEISKDINLYDEIESTMTVVGTGLALNNIEIKRNIPKDLPYIEACRKDLQHIFTNIIVNAGHAMEKNCKEKKKAILSLEGFHKNNEIIITISDTGLGIPKDKINQIFTPFYTTKGPGKGTGMGLFIVYQMTMRNSGKLSVKSKVGEGTTFTLEFPRYIEKKKA